MSLTDPVRRYSACVHDRYPSLFHELAITITPKTIMSYGCGMGQELLTLRNYFKDAMIYGVDIQPNALESARGLTQKDERIEIINAGALDWFCMKVDCVFALNVFKRQSDSDFDRKPYTESDFTSDILELSKFVSEGGYLVTDGIQYQIMDMPELARIFRPVPLNTDTLPRHEFCDTDKLFFSKNYLFQLAGTK